MLNLASPPARTLNRRALPGSEKFSCPPPHLAQPNTHVTLLLNDLRETTMASQTLLREMLRVMGELAKMRAGPKARYRHLARRLVCLADLAPARQGGAAGLLRDEARQLDHLSFAPVSAGLSPRCARVLRHLLTGQSERRIAEALCLSPHTVHDYVKRIYQYYGVHSRAQLSAACARKI